jgi:hypothetical protein
MHRILLALLLAALLVPTGALAQPADVVGSAAERTLGIDTYRLQFSLRARGTMADPLARTPPAGEVVLADFTGVFARDDSVLLYRSPDVAALGYDPERGIEMTIVRKTAYAVGPLPVGGAYEARWYNLGPSAAAPIRPPVQLGGVLEDLTGELSPSQLTRVRFEQLDRKRCTMYRGGADAVTAALVGLGRAVTNETGKSVAQQLAGVRMDKAEYLAWACDDGYLRQVRVTASGYQTQRPSLRFGVDILLRVTEIGSRTLTVKPPIDAVRLRASPAGRATALSAGDMRRTPSDEGLVLGQLQARERVELLDRTADSSWYRVRAAVGTGWVPASLLRVPAGQRQVAAIGESPAAAPPPAEAPSPEVTATPAP